MAEGGYFPPELITDPAGLRLIATELSEGRWMSEKLVPTHAWKNVRLPPGAGPYVPWFPAANPDRFGWWLVPPVNVYDVFDALKGALWLLRRFAHV